MKRWYSEHHAMPFCVIGVDNLLQIRSIRADEQKLEPFHVLRLKRFRLVIPERKSQQKATNSISHNTSALSKKRLIKVRPLPKKQCHI